MFPLCLSLAFRCLSSERARLGEDMRLGFGAVCLVVTFVRSLTVSGMLSFLSKLAKSPLCRFPMSRNSNRSTWFSSRYSDTVAKSVNSIATGSSKRPSFSGRQLAQSFGRCLKSLFFNGLGFLP